MGGGQPQPAGARGPRPVPASVSKSLKKNDLDLWKCTSLGLELAVALGLGAYAGHLIDRWLETEPWMLVLGCGLGLAAGMIRIIRTVADLQSRGGGPDDDRA